MGFGAGQPGPRHSHRSAAVGARPVAVELRGISRRFGRLRALDRVDLAVARGEVVGLLGENGAGKTTLMNVLYGLVEPDRGEIRLDGHAVRIRSPRQARRLGVGMVHQHFTLVGELTVAENFALDEGGWGWLRFARRRVEARLRGLAVSLGLDVDPAARVAELSVGARQRVEILKALKDPDGRVLILDEPTAMLTPGEIDELFPVIRRLADSGRAVIFISHKLREVMAVTDRTVVLRGGRVVAERRTAATSADELGELMVGGGRPGPAVERSPPATFEGMARPVLLEVLGLVVTRPGRGPAAVRGIDLRLTAGEVVGIAGVDGNGQGELMEALAGLRPAAGTIAVAGRRLSRPTPRSLIELGVAYVPADRRRFGLVEGLSVAENLLLGHHRRREFAGVAGLLDRRRIEAHGRQLSDWFDLRAASLATDVGRLSGGNQQRLVLARHLAFSPRILLVENPTRGLDVAATRFVHDRLRAARDRGSAILLVSTDLDEVLALADRLRVIYQGRLREPRSRHRGEVGALMGGAG